MTHHDSVSIEEHGYAMDRWYFWRATREHVYAEGKAQTYLQAAKQATKALRRPDSVAWYPRAPQC